MLIAFDFDGTVVNPEFPAIGKEYNNAIDTLKKLQKTHNLILHTARNGVYLKECIDWLESKGVKFDVWKNTGKPNADVFIEDRGLMGLPRTFDDQVDWVKIYNIIDYMVYINKRNHG